MNNKRAVVTTRCKAVQFNLQLAVSRYWFVVVTQNDLGRGDSCTFRRVKSHCVTCIKTRFASG